MLKGALIILFDSDKKILLQYRTADAPVYPHYWAFFGGNTDSEEKVREALKREALEELNYKIKKPIFVTRLIRLGKEHNFFIEKYDGKELTLNEGEKMTWFTIEEAKRLKMAPHHQEVLEMIKEKICSLP